MEDTNTPLQGVVATSEVTFASTNVADLENFQQHRRRMFTALGLQLIAGRIRFPFFLSRNSNEFRS